jgi:LemA protein
LPWSEVVRHFYLLTPQKRNHSLSAKEYIMTSLTFSAIGAIALVLLFILVVSYGVTIFNSLVQVRNNVDKAFKNIDVLLMQRHEELPKLIDTCRGYMKHEREILDKLTALREHYAQAGSADEKTAIENDLNRQYRLFTGRFESYPDLKANQNFLQIQDRISGLESAIADRREFFNDSVNIYNIQIERFPHLILARILNYARKLYLEVPEEKKQDVKMAFS